MKKNSIFFILLMGVLATIAFSLFHAPPQIATKLKAENTPPGATYSNVSLPAKTKPLEASSNSNTLANLVKTNSAVEVFKTVIYTNGMYLCTDSNRQNLYVKMPDGSKTVNLGNIYSHLKIKEPTNGVAQGITGLKMVDKMVIISVDGQDHPVRFF